MSQTAVLYNMKCILSFWWWILVRWCLVRERIFWFSGGCVVVVVSRILCVVLGGKKAQLLNANFLSCMAFGACPNLYLCGTFWHIHNKNYTPYVWNVDVGFVDRPNCQRIFWFIHNSFSVAPGSLLSDPKDDFQYLFTRFLFVLKWKTKFW